jgi:hypothetical protein
MAEFDEPASLYLLEGKRRTEAKFNALRSWEVTSGMRHTSVTFDAKDAWTAMKPLCRPISFTSPMPLHTNKAVHSDPQLKVPTIQKQIKTPPPPNKNTTQGAGGHTSSAAMAHQ